MSRLSIDEQRRRQRNEYMKAWRKKNPEYLKAWRKENPDYMLHWNEANLMRRVYLRSKHHAIERGIRWDLSFKDYAAMAIRTQYIDKRGRTRESYTIDRKKTDPKIGYTKKNIRVVTMSCNVRLQRKLEFHMRTNNNHTDLFRWTQPVFKGEIVHL